VTRDAVEPARVLPLQVGMYVIYTCRTQVESVRNDWELRKTPVGSQVPGGLHRLGGHGWRIVDPYERTEKSLMLRA
jgi:hypothetical protein